MSHQGSWMSQFDFCWQPEGKREASEAQTGIPKMQAISQSITQNQQTKGLFVPLSLVLWSHQV